jgi:hypothetical protein
MIAPFALLPDIAGIVLWSLLTTWLLYKAIIMLPLNVNAEDSHAMDLLCRTYNQLHSLQINPAIAAWILFTCIFIEKRKKAQQLYLYC